MDIIYEDKDCVVVNKPSGLIVHEDGRGAGGEPTLTDWIVKTYPQTKNVGEPIILPDGTTLTRPGIVHRLDKETSGALIIAKTAEAHARLKEQFQSREIKKRYRAFVYGTLKDDEGKINRPIGRSKNDFRLWTAMRGTRGPLREAETWYTVLRRGETPEGQFTYVEVVPRTGRTHQIRVHFKSIHYPIVCDRLYAPNKPCALGFGRLALHSYELVFRSAQGELITARAPLPPDFIFAEAAFAK